MNDIIVALATPHFESALAIIRVSGQGCFDILRKIFNHKNFKEENRNYYGKIIDDGKTIDEVIVNIFPFNKSFTGEDSFEINCHGNLLIINEIINLIIKNGARMACNGEYSKRAFLNNKIDLIQAEAINDLVNAESIESKELALMALDGKTSDLLINFKNKIVKLITNIEVNIDFPEYDDQEIVTKKEALLQIEEILKENKELIEENKKGKIIKEGLKIAIIGYPNVGKSSLLNAIINEEKAIITNIAGTTRDIIEGSIKIKGLKVNLYDTAGIRKSNRIIENIGIKKSKEVIDKSDLILFLLDANKKETDQDREMIKLAGVKDYLVVYNKVDLKGSKKEGKISISAKENDIDDLLKELEKYIEEKQIKYDNKPMLTNTRHLGGLNKIYNILLDTRKQIKEDIPIDMINTDLLIVINLIEEIIGNSTKFDLYEEIFSNFCLGK